MHTQSRLKRGVRSNAPAPAPVSARADPQHSPGGALKARLAKLGVHTLTDILFVLPARYEDRTHIAPIGTLLAGKHAVVEGEVLLAEIVFRRRRQLLVRIADGTGSLTLRFFYFSNAQREGFVRGTRLRCHGEIRRGPLGLEMVHPEYRRIAGADEPLPRTLTPIYPLTEGLTQGRLRALIERALGDAGAAPLAELLPTQVLQILKLPSLGDALEFMHRPPVGTSLVELAEGRHPAQRRLAFEELLAHQLALMQLRRDLRREFAADLGDRAGLEARLLAALPFALTAAQQRVVGEIDADLAASSPMARLVQGDVGCGKTVVAAAAAARAIGSGYQSAFMAPTELLAEQHWRSLSRWFAPLGVQVLLLTGGQSSRARRAALAATADGSAQLVVGTHALFQDDVQFRHLALAIIDEQHRFGVQQRLRLRQKGARSKRGALPHWPHQLIMTATPIPRTLAMTAYADLDISVIDELPPGRTPVRTVVMSEDKRAQIVARIEAACRAGRQAYWVCALIEESEELTGQAAEETAHQLAQALPNVRVGLVHGRMPVRQKEAAMQAFTAGETQLLVATTVVEVGVDVANANLMVIENAERLGLAQLHQLRGRVGRGVHDSSCVLLYHAPLSEMARARLAAIRETNDGFVIARRDLELRGAGELLGTRQTGLAQLRIADLVRDADLLDHVRMAARSMLDGPPERTAALRTRWIAHGEHYGRVG